MFVDLASKHRMKAYGSLPPTREESEATGASGLRWPAPTMKVWNSGVCHVRRYIPRSGAPYLRPCGGHTQGDTRKPRGPGWPVATIAIMTSMTEAFCQALQTALANRTTVSIRGTLIDVLERDPSKAEISAAHKAARRIAKDGDAVLISLLPDQAGADAYLPSVRGAIGRASNYLTLDEEIIKDLPCRVELASEKWDALIDEGMRRTQQEIENDPHLSAMLPDWQAVPRAEARARSRAEAAESS